ncbi:MAG: iron-sulfur cluster assembly protein [Alphaproteobacteria bacterium]|nr:iron-sulfur cluster assembly protein [Alphaproteobacteria bacterium]
MENPSEAELGANIVDQLRLIYDPEIPVNIFDLGLIYAIDVKTKDNGLFDASVTMTLTSPNCPVAEDLPKQVEEAIRAINGADHVVVSVTWDPPWDKSRMSDEARILLNMF